MFSVGGMQIRHFRRFRRNGPFLAFGTKNTVCATPTKVPTHTHTQCSTSTSSACPASTAPRASRARESMVGPEKKQCACAGWQPVPKGPSLGISPAICRAQKYGSARPRPPRGSRKSPKSQEENLKMSVVRGFRISGFWALSMAAEIQTQPYQKHHSDGKYSELTTPYCSILLHLGPLLQLLVEKCL